MPDRSDRAKAVLSYLERMLELCRRAHRPDLVTEYEDAWETAATAILGPLPKRPDNRAIHTPGEIVPRPLTPGQRESLARPWRKIIARDGEMEILECGHRMLHVEYPGSPIPKRRRCRDCYAEAQTKKPATGETLPPTKEGATA